MAFQLFRGASPTPETKYKLPKAAGDVCLLPPQTRALSVTQDALVYAELTRQFINIRTFYGGSCLAK